MPRPTVLIVEPEPGQALSTRKLVLETGKYNVLTAHSTKEGFEIFHLFPNISAAVLVQSEHTDAESIGATMKDTVQKLPVIVLSPGAWHHSKVADHVLSSHEPHQLLELLRSMLGDPREMDQGISIPSI